MSGPLGRTGRLLLESLGITKGSSQFLTSMKQEIQPIINVTPFVFPETYQELTFSNAALALGHNTIYTNTTGQTQYLIGGMHATGTLGAGITIEARMTVFSSGNPPWYAVLSEADTASGVNEQMLTGKTFFDAPIVIPPNWGVGCWITNLVGAVPNVISRLLISSPN